VCLKSVRVGGVIGFSSEPGVGVGFGAFGASASFLFNSWRDGFGTVFLNEDWFVVGKPRFLRYWHFLYKLRSLRFPLHSSTLKHQESMCSASALSTRSLTTSTSLVR
jgi:hypothetical protein